MYSHPRLDDAMSAELAAQRAHCVAQDLRAAMRGEQALQTGFVEQGGTVLDVRARSRGVQSSNVLRQDPDAHEMGREPLQPGNSIEQTERTTDLETIPVEDTAEHSLLYGGLYRLGRPRGKLAPALHAGEVPVRKRSAPQRLRKGVCRGNRVLDGEIDADASNRRPRVGAITDTQQARPPPALQAVDLDDEELDLLETS